MYVPLPGSSFIVAEITDFSNLNNIVSFIIKMLWKSGIHRSLVLIHRESWKLSYVRNGPEQMCLVIRIARQFLMCWQLVVLRVENMF